MRLGQRGLRTQIADVERALDGVLHARPGDRDQIDRSGGAAPFLRADTGADGIVDDQLLRFRVVPERGFERGQFGAGEVFLGALPDFHRLGNVGVAVEAGKILGHGGNVCTGMAASGDFMVMSFPQCTAHL
ncbi:MAG: hypothetical protein IPH23_14875 [Gammaproteobacteria bacterium]|nr:hypothetical protein [Gammaproteobacteria bacterium]